MQLTVGQQASRLDRPTRGFWVLIGLVWPAACVGVTWGAATVASLASELVFFAPLLGGPVALAFHPSVRDLPARRRGGYVAGGVVIGLLVGAAILVVIAFVILLSLPDGYWN